MRAPTAGWARTQAHSSSVSGPGLAEHRSGRADAADVVQDAREPYALHALGRQAELASGQLREAAHALAVAWRCPVAHVERLGDLDERRQLHV